MNKIKVIMLLLGVIVPTAFSIAKKDHVAKNGKDPIVIFNKATHGQSDKSEIPISASIDGHALTIYINENVGIAHIVVTDRNGVYIDRDNLLHTPDVATLFIDDAGFYTVTITLHNGDVYSGDFMVTE